MPTIITKGAMTSQALGYSNARSPSANWVLGFYPGGYYFAPYQWGLAVDPSENVYVNFSWGAAGGPFYSKIDKTGTFVWGKTVPGSNTYGGDYFRQILLYYNNAFYSTFYDHTNGNVATLFSFDTNGNVLWTKRVNKNDSATESTFNAMTNDGGTIYASGILSSGFGWSVGLLVAVDSSTGNLINYWQLTNVSQFRGVASKAGHVFVSTTQTSGSYSAIRIVKVDPSSLTTPFWSVLVSRAANQSLVQMVCDYNGNTYSLISDSTAMSVVSLDVSGNQRWTCSYKNGSNANIPLTSISVRDDGNLSLTTGYNTSCPNVIIVNSTDGSVLYSRTIGFSGVNNEQGYSTIDSNGKFYFTSIYGGYGSGTNNSYFYVNKMNLNLTPTGTYTFPPGSSYLIGNPYSATSQSQTYTVTSSPISWYRPSSYPATLNTVTGFTMGTYTPTTNKLNL